MRRVTCLVALAAVVALALPSGGRATVMQVAQPVPDFNYDGFGDLAVGAPGENVGSAVDAGAISVLYGRATGMRSDRRVITQNSPGVAGLAERCDRFGAALVAGRFNGDRFWDLAVGAPGEDVGRDRDAGAVIILYGSDHGLRTGRRLPLTQPNPEPDDRFGFSLAVGEISGTARAELVVGAPGETIRRASGAGAVNVIDNPAGTSPSQRVLYQGKGMSGSPERGDNFGWDVVANDFMNTAITGGRDSLAVGVPGEDVRRAVDAGAVNIRYAVASPGRRLLVLYQDRPERGDGFGTALGDGVFDQANGTVDLAVGAPGETVRGRRAAGAVSVVKNNNSGFQAGSQVFYQGRGGGVRGRPEAGDRFGAAVAVGAYGRNLGGLALGGLAVGVPGEDVGRAADAGVLTVLFGLSGVGQQLLTQKEAGGRVEAGDRFGEALSDPFGIKPGLHEALGVGSPGETVNGQVGAGAFSVLIGAASGGLPTGQTFYQGPRSRTLLTVGGTPEAGDALGAAILSSGRPRTPARPGRRTPPPPPV
jgi:FG-GAP repeat